MNLVVHKHTRASPFHNDGDGRMVVIMNHRFGSCHVESTASPFADRHFAYGQLIASNQSAVSALLALVALFAA